MNMRSNSPNGIVREEFEKQMGPHADIRWPKFPQEIDELDPVLKAFRSQDNSQPVYSARGLAAMVPGHREVEMVFDIQGVEVTLRGDGKTYVVEEVSVNTNPNQRPSKTTWTAKALQTIKNFARNREWLTSLEPAASINDTVVQGPKPSKDPAQVRRLGDEVYKLERR